MEEYSVEEFAKDFVKDRNEAFLSLDKDKIIAYCKKYDVEIPENETIFWAGVHKVICNLYLSTENVVSLEKYDESYKWLAKHRLWTISGLGGVKIG